MYILWPTLHRHEIHCRLNWTTTTFFSCSSLGFFVRHVKLGAEPNRLATHTLAAIEGNTHAVTSPVPRHREGCGCIQGAVRIQAVKSRRMGSKNSLLLGTGACIPYTLSFTALEVCFLLINARRVILSVRRGVVGKRREGPDRVAQKNRMKRI